VAFTWIRVSALALAALVVARPAQAADKPAATSAAAPAPPPAPTATPAPPPAPAAAPAPPADAEAVPASPQEAEMQTQRALGHRLFRLGRYEEAVAAFRRAYEIKADARLLYDIAECYREVGAVDQALFYYDRYLAGWPEAFDRAEVEEKVGELENRRGNPAAPHVAGARRSRPIMVTEPPPSKPKQQPHAWQRWWFWTAIGVGVLGGIGAAVLSSGSGNTAPMTDLGDKRFF
jgi:tetratricopeptide (TPR) repeat protein